MHARHLLEHPDDLAAVPVFVVVPDVQHGLRVGADGGQAVDDAGPAGAEEVAGDHLGRVDVVDLLVQLGVQRHGAQVGVELVLGGALREGEVEDRHRHVGRGHPDGVAGELAGQLGQRLGDGLRGPCLGDHHVQGGAAPAAVARMEVVDQVLVVGERVHRLHMAFPDTEAVVHGLEHGRDRVGGAGCRRDDGVVRGDGVVVDAVHDVLQRALARSREQHPGDTRAGQVLAESVGVAPASRVVDHDSVLDAVSGVVDGGRVARVDDLDQRAVGEDRVAHRVDGDGALEWSVHRVAAQQARPLDDVVIRPAAHHDGPQAQTLSPAGVVNQDAREETSDPAEAVQHDIRARGDEVTLPVDDIRQLGPEEFLPAAPGTLEFVGHGQPAEVDRRGPEPEGAEGLQQRQGLLQGQFHIVDVAREAVRLEQSDHRLVDQSPAVHARDDVIFPIQTADQGDHLFSECLPVDPRGQSAIRFLKQKTYPSFSTASLRRVCRPPGLSLRCATRRARVPSAVRTPWTRVPRR